VGSRATGTNGTEKMQTKEERQAGEGCNMGNNTILFGRVKKQLMHSEEEKKSAL